MASTFTIPLTTLPVGARTVGPSHPANAEVSVTLTIDRTVTGGLNSLTSASGVGVDLQESLDGGVTWQDLGAWTAEGGPITNRHGVVYPATSGTWQLIPGTSRQLQATITVSGPSPVAVAGSIVTT